MRYSKNGKADKSVGLIETWDVLKYKPLFCVSPVPFRLIETWDVLKWWYQLQSDDIERWLIETWDVLKYSSMRYSFPGLGD